MEFKEALTFSLRRFNPRMVSLKEKQIEAIENLYEGKDVVAILPTGYGKSMIYQILPYLFSYKKYGHADPCKCIVLVISPLNALIRDQVEKLRCLGIRATCLDVKETDDEEDELCFGDNFTDVECGNVHILFAHPEAIVSNKKGRSLLLKKEYKENIVAVAVDEAHCCVDWGHDFRPDYSRLCVLASLFPDVPHLALTATATKKYESVISSSLCLNEPVIIRENPNRPNITFEKFVRPPRGKESFKAILEPLAKDLKEKTLEFPLTFIYLPLEWCGYAFVLFSHILGNDQYQPTGCERIPSFRLFNQYHAPQTEMMKTEILSSLMSTSSSIRVVFATVALGMGLDCPRIHQVIHIGVPRTMESYFQETGRAGRDGNPAKAILYYNNSDIASNKRGMSDAMRHYCKNEDGICLRKQILNYFDFDKPETERPDHFCCSVCEEHCSCLSCRCVENVEMEVVN